MKDSQKMIAIRRKCVTINVTKKLTIFLPGESVDAAGLTGSIFVS